MKYSNKSQMMRGTENIYGIIISVEGGREHDKLLKVMH